MSPEIIHIGETPSVKIDKVGCGMSSPDINPDLSQLPIITAARPTPAPPAIAGLINDLLTIGFPLIRSY